MIGILVEGPDDRACYEIIARKLAVRTSVRVLHGKPNLLDADKVERHVRALLGSHGGLQKVIAVVDADCDEPGTSRHAQASEHDLQGRGLGVLCRYFVVRFKLESWLAQPDALFQAFGRKVKPPSQVESHRAERFLGKHRAPRKYVPSRDNRLLAQALDVNLLAQQNTNFREFGRLLADP